MNPKSLPIKLLLLCTILAATYGANTQNSRARIESCPGCSLNRLPEVRKFIYEDVPKYENVEFKKIQGAPPELVVLNEADEEMERVALGELDREQCNVELKSRGFKLKDEARPEL